MQSEKIENEVLQKEKLEPLNPVLVKEQTVLWGELNDT